MRLPPEQFGYYKQKYSDYAYDEQKENRLKNLVRDRFDQGDYYLSKQLFLEIAAWKTPRQRSNYESNVPTLVAEATNIAFGVAKNERIRIEILTLLAGVSYPVASTLLHFAFPERYPILDFRAIWSLGLEQPSFYSFNFWWHFVKRMHEESRKLKVSIRDLDKALWAYSKENQSGGISKGGIGKRVRL
jgi:hypothetical protein